MKLTITPLGVLALRVWLEGEGKGEEMAYTFREWYVPDRMMEGIRRYIEQGIPPGDFLTAVIDNNLSEAMGRADDENLRNLPAILAYFYNEAPGSCWGSPEKRREWVKTFTEDPQAQRQAVKDSLRGMEGQ